MRTYILLRCVSYSMCYIDGCYLPHIALDLIDSCEFSFGRLNLNLLAEYINKDIYSPFYILLLLFIDV